MGAGVEYIEYVAEKIKNIEKRKPQVTIRPIKIENKTRPESHVAADASRNSVKTETVTVFALHAFSMSNKSQKSIWHVDTVPVRRKQDLFMRFIMEALEHRTLSKHIEEDKPRMVLIDGSLLTPAGIVPQYPNGKFESEYKQNKELYDEYLRRFKEVIEKTYDNLNERGIKVALFNLQFEDFSDDYNDLKELHEKILGNLTLKSPNTETENFIQFLAYYEYLYETERLYRLAFERDHVAISKTSMTSYITDNYQDKLVVRLALTKNNAYPGYVPFEIKFDEDTHEALPAYTNPEENFPTLMNLYREPPLAAYFAFSKVTPVYVAETYNDIEDILEKVLYLSPPPAYYPQPLFYAHNGSKITNDIMATIVNAIKNKALSLSLERTVRRPLD